jgi:hypothetical protein
MAVRKIEDLHSASPSIRNNFKFSPSIRNKFKFLESFMFDGTCIISLADVPDQISLSDEKVCTLIYNVRSISTDALCTIYTGWDSHLVHQSHRHDGLPFCSHCIAFFFCFEIYTTYA